MTQTPILSRASSRSQALHSLLSLSSGVTQTALEDTCSHWIGLTADAHLLAVRWGWAGVWKL